MNDLEQNGNSISSSEGTPVTTTKDNSPLENLNAVDQKPMIPNAMGTTSIGADVIREEDKIMLVLAYLFPFIPFFTTKDNDYVIWHARQGLVNWILSCLISFTCIGWLFCVFVMIKGIQESLKPNRWKAPVVSNITEVIFKN